MVGKEKAQTLVPFRDIACFLDRDFIHCQSPVQGRLVLKQWWTSDGQNYRTAQVLMSLVICLNWNLLLVLQKTGLVVIGPLCMFLFLAWPH